MLGWLLGRANNFSAPPRTVSVEVNEEKRQCVGEKEGRLKSEEDKEGN